MGLWLFQVAGINADRQTLDWAKDPAISAFMADPQKVLNQEVRLQEKTADGWRLMAKAFRGDEFMDHYAGRPATVIRRQGFGNAKTFSFLYLDEGPEREVKILVRAMDNDKKDKALVAFKINGHEVFRGPVNFDKKWSKQFFRAPKEFFQKNKNLIEFENITPGLDDGTAGPAEVNNSKNSGWFMLGSVDFFLNNKEAAHKNNDQLPAPQSSRNGEPPTDSARSSANMMANSGGEKSGPNRVLSTLPPGWGFYKGSGAVEVGISEQAPASGEKSVFLRFMDQSIINGHKYINVALISGESDGYSGSKALPGIAGDYSVSVMLKGDLPFLQFSVLSWDTDEALPEDRQTMRRSGLKKIVPTENWKKYSAAFKLGAEAKKFAVCLGIAGQDLQGLKPGQTVYVDEFAITKQPAAKAPLPEN
jgi:hypothetical protein